MRDSFYGNPHELCEGKWTNFELKWNISLPQWGKIPSVSLIDKLIMIYDISNNIPKPCYNTCNTTFGFIH